MLIPLSDLIDVRNEGSVSCENVITNIIQQLELQVSEEERPLIPLALGMKDSINHLFQYRNFVDFCRHQNLYHFESINTQQQQQQQQRRTLLSVNNDGSSGGANGANGANGAMLSSGAGTELRRGGGGALNRAATGGASTSSSAGRRHLPRGGGGDVVSDYAEVVKYKQLVDASTVRDFINLLFLYSQYIYY